MKKPTSQTATINQRYTRASPAERRMSYLTLGRGGAHPAIHGCHEANTYDGVSFSQRIMEEGGRQSEWVEERDRCS